MNTRAWLFLLPALAGSLPDSAAASATIHLNVDLTDAPRQLFHVHETLAVVPGPLTLNYPKWVPGEHSPSGPLENLAGLKFSAGGKPLAWRRDLEDMYAVHLDVPTGVDALDADFDFLSPMYGGVYGQSVSATPDLADLEWNQVLLYPAGKASQDIVFEASVTLPVDWNYATALEPGAHAKGATGFKPVSLDELVDSPLIAGRYFRRVDLVPGGGVPVHLDVVADAAADLDISAEQTDRFRSLVTQAYALFGAHHYDHYDFLLTLSDNTGHFGLEHHQSPAMTARGRTTSPSPAPCSWATTSCPTNTSIPGTASSGALQAFGPPISTVRPCKVTCCGCTRVSRSISAMYSRPAAASGPRSSTGSSWP